MYIDVKPYYGIEYGGLIFVKIEDIFVVGLNDVKVMHTRSHMVLIKSPPSCHEVSGRSDALPHPVMRMSIGFSQSPWPILLGNK